MGLGCQVTDTTVSISVFEKLQQNSECHLQSQQSLSNPNITKSEQGSVSEAGKMNISSMKQNFALEYIHQEKFARQ